MLIGKRKPLVENLLLVEGISRAGKFLLANLLAGFKGIEPMQYYGLLELIPVFTKLRFIDKRMAEELIQCEIDTHCYEMLIGRNFNLRLSDKSSIFNHPRHKEYLKRCSQEDGDAALKKFYKEKPYSFFIMHELMPNIDIYFDLYPKLKIINIQRSPVDLVFSWYKRGLVRRFKNDPKNFIIPLEEKKSVFPWYVYPHQKKISALSEMDKTIFIIDRLFNIYENKFKILSENRRKKIIFVRYEDIIFKPRKVVRHIAGFLQKKPLPQMSGILKREKLPNKLYSDSKNKKIAEIRKIASGLYFNKLLKIEKKYFSS
ncbi:MAG: sulfotransferase domain-containing protein [Patescibacteria group bacterium]